jgi:hypothetical protein
LRACSLSLAIALAQSACDVVVVAALITSPAGVEDKESPYPTRSLCRSIQKNTKPTERTKSVASRNRKRKLASSQAQATKQVASDKRQATSESKSQAN